MYKGQWDTLPGLQQVAALRWPWKPSQWQGACLLTRLLGQCCQEPGIEEAYGVEAQLEWWERENDGMLGDARGRKASGRRRCSAGSPREIVGVGRPQPALGKLELGGQGQIRKVGVGVGWQDREPAELFFLS